MQSNILISSRFSLCSAAIISVFLAGCATPGTQRVAVNDAAVKAEERKQMEIVADEILSEQIRLNNIRWRIATKGKSVCREDVGPLLGLQSMTRPKGQMGDILAAKHGITEKPTVIHVVLGSPADLAGVRKGDILKSIDGIEIASPQSLEDVNGKWVQGSPFRISLERSGSPVTVAATPEIGCKYPVGLSPQQIINAFADGKRVMIARGMMNFAKDDNELALVVSHEIAHNSMKHIDSKKQNMGLGFLADLATVLLSKGQISNTNFAGMAASAYSQEFEAEADYVGLYLMANAGLPIDDAPRFWRRMAAAHPQNIKTNHSASHPSTSYRMVALEETVKEIQGKISRSEPLLPNMKDGKPFIPK